MRLEINSKIVCVCVCVREREREVALIVENPKKKKNAIAKQISHRNS